MLCLTYEASQCRLLEEAVLNKANDDLLLRFDLDPDPDPDPDAMDPDDPLKHPKSLMIRPANPPDLSLLLPPLLATLLGSLSSPSLPPSTSVYTTGIPPLHPPGTLPTANPPPGNLQIVIPAEESSSPASSRPATVVAATSSSSSAGSSWRQTGQELRMASQGRMQSGWYIWLHGISRAAESRMNVSLQTAQ